MDNSAATMIEEINAAVRDDDIDLTPWEADFIQNIQANVTAGFDLTEKQDAVLVRIWKKCVGQE